MSEIMGGGSAATNVAQGRTAGISQGIVAVVAMFLPTLAFLSLPATLPKLLLHFQTDPRASVLVPLIVTAPALCIALLSPIIGLLADRYGRRPVMLTAIIVFCVCGMLPLLLDDLSLIVASRFGLGIANAALLTLGATLIGDYFGDAKRHLWLTINGVAGTVMATLAIAAGGLLADIDWRGPFALYGLGLPLFLFSLRALWEPRRPVDTDAAAAVEVPWRLLGSTALLIAAIAAIFFVQPVQIGLVLANTGLKSTSTIGLISALASIGVPLGSLLYGYVAQRPVNHLLALGLALNTVGLVGIGLAHTPLGVGLASFPQQIGNGLLLPTSIYWMQSQAPFVVRARAMGLWSTAFFAGQFFSPWGVSLGTAALGSLQRSIVACGVVALMMMVISLLAYWFRSGRRADGAKRSARLNSSNG